ncbi:hypothetical protein NDU88_000622 [Pleurodeles waltl]|uniref:Uncharacterized protein n=1 Tax=Pleurodeles waltl TaxID=8319 RepID=A0AAV7SX27_PLEWA|nr:hypothetical protein NDU88_000622 [Pleurodeles waltl]
MRGGGHPSPKEETWGSEAAAHQGRLCNSSAVRLQGQTGEEDRTAGPVGECAGVLRPMSWARSNSCCCRRSLDVGWWRLAADGGPAIFARRHAHPLRQGAVLRGKTAWLAPVPTGPCGERFGAFFAITFRRVLCLGAAASCYGRGESPAGASVARPGSLLAALQRRYGRVRPVPREGPRPAGKPKGGGAEGGAKRLVRGGQADAAHFYGSPTKARRQKHAAGTAARGGTRRKGSHTPPGVRFFKVVGGAPIDRESTSRSTLEAAVGPEGAAVSVTLRGQAPGVSQRDRALKPYGAATRTASQVIFQGRQGEIEDLHAGGTKKGKKGLQVYGDSYAWRGGELGGAEEEGMKPGPVAEEGGDNRVLVCAKWPTMLVWSD